jgi:hypothetical protein
VPTLLWPRLPVVVTVLAPPTPAAAALVLLVVVVPTPVPPLPLVDSSPVLDEAASPDELQASRGLNHRIVQKR